MQEPEPPPRRRGLEDLLAALAQRARANNEASGNNNEEDASAEQDSAPGEHSAEPGEQNGNLPSVDQLEEGCASTSSTCISALDLASYILSLLSTLILQQSMITCPLACACKASIRLPELCCRAGGGASGSAGRIGSHDRAAARHQAARFKACGKGTFAREAVGGAPEAAGWSGRPVQCLQVRTLSRAFLSQVGFWFAADR